MMSSYSKFTANCELLMMVRSHVTSGFSKQMLMLIQFLFISFELIEDFLALICFDILRQTFVDFSTGHFSTLFHTGILILQCLVSNT